MAKKHWYAVHKGKIPGVYTTWPECQAQVHGFLGARFKGFLKDEHKYAVVFSETGRDVRDGNVPVAAASQPLPSNPQAGKPKIEKLRHTAINLAPQKAPIKHWPPIKIEDDEDKENPTPGGRFELPPSSQSYFTTSINFQPNANTEFDVEFKRLMKSRNIPESSQEYQIERTKAIKVELNFHYSQEVRREASPEASQGQSRGIPYALGGKEPNAELSSQDKLLVYQNMCRAVDLEPADNIDDCARDLKTKVLVNIIDFIDARRTGTKVVVWDNWHRFKNYTLQPTKRINLRLAREDEFLRPLLQHLRRGPPPQFTLACRRSVLGKRKQSPDVGGDGSDHEEWLDHDEPVCRKHARLE